MIRNSIIVTSHTFDSKMLEIVWYYSVISRNSLGKNFKQFN